MGELSLPDEARRAADVIRRADIVIGIPSYNNGRTIGHVVRAAYAGLAKYFPQLTAVVINSDGGSTDNTRDAVLSARIEDSHLMLLSTDSLSNLEPRLSPRAEFGEAFETAVSGSRKQQNHERLGSTSLNVPMAATTREVPTTWNYDCHSINKAKERITQKGVFPSNLSTGKNTNA